MVKHELLQRVGSRSGFWMMFVAFFMRFEFSHGFFIAGIAPHTFAEGEVVSNHLTLLHSS